MITCQDNCSIIKCGDAWDEPQIDFPFVVNDRQGGECGYPGFNITCNVFRKSKTVLEISRSEEFLVRKIDYFYREIRLYDQDNCLARRLRYSKFDLSPFKAYGRWVYAFFYCPPSIISDPSVVAYSSVILNVPCLSSPTATVVVTLSSAYYKSYQNVSDALFNGGCQVDASVYIPISSKASSTGSFYDFTTDDLYLTWVQPVKPSPREAETNVPLPKEDETKDPEVDEKRINWKKLATIIAPSLGGIVAIATIVCVICRRKQRR
ncbi:hypothetical protein C5167_047594 [Papaver somniferum]|uniref:RING-type E3 ubiquitin transferase n=1 Tax=Papaver somniferum TaxID=3469 RepID=A0A4Y7LH48_PAPSO|nr:hypothetical protein C5167_047594 [Papaver somniferum]